MGRIALFLSRAPSLSQSCSSCPSMLPCVLLWRFPFHVEEADLRNVALTAYVLNQVGILGRAQVNGAEQL